MKETAMNKDESTAGGRTKKSYSKPEVKQVELRPEEAVLGACKVTGHSGPGSSNCHTPSNCFTQGS
jgi:hypothetical protein